MTEKPAYSWCAAEGVRILQQFKKDNARMLRSKPGGKPIKLVLDNDGCFASDVFLKPAKKLIPGGILPLPKRSPDLMICDYWLHNQVKLKALAGQIYPLKNGGWAKAVRKITKWFADEPAKPGAQANMTKRVKAIEAKPEHAAEDGMRILKLR